MAQVTLGFLWWRPGSFEVTRTSSRGTPDMRHGFADGALVLVVHGGIEQAVARAQRIGHGFGAGNATQRVGAEADGGERGAVVEGVVREDMLFPLLCDTNRLSLPAKAGIQLAAGAGCEMDPCFRRDDTLCLGRDQVALPTAVAARSSTFSGRSSKLE